MTDEELELKNFIAECRNSFCPLYSAFWNGPNAQSKYRNNQYKWAKKFYPKRFKIGEEVFGAKFVIIMESPPPKYLEYFYGPKGESKPLFSSVIRTIAAIEGLPEGNIESKDVFLKWLAEIGIMIIDAAKCRMKITPEILNEEKEPKTEKISNSEIEQVFEQCSEILKLQLKTLNPFCVGIGIASVFDHLVYGEPYIKNLLRELGIENAFNPNRTVSVFARNREDEFPIWLKNEWLRVKNDLSKYKLEYI